MEIEDEIIVEDDIDIIDIIDFGFPRRFFNRSNYIEEMDDMSFFRRFRLTKPTVIAVLELLEDQLEFDNDLNNSVSPVNQLLTGLLFYASSAHQINIGDIMRMDQGTVSRIISKVSQSIASLRNRFIKMPSTPQEIITCQNNFYRIARFPRVIGCVDGTHIKIRSSGDSGYPLRSYLLTPLGNPGAPAEQLYNEAQIRTRNCIERTNGVLKRRFPALCYGLRCNLNNALSTIVATAVLHNVARRMHEDEAPPPMGINDEELNYLIDQGEIPNINVHGNVMYDFRRDLIITHFGNLGQ
ncbi:hypothetical protein NQ315_006100, partial [Exocentrus adspersus]